MCVCVLVLGAGQFLRYNARSHVTKAWRLQHFVGEAQSGKDMLIQYHLRLAGRVSNSVSGENCKPKLE